MTRVMWLWRVYKWPAISFAVVTAVCSLVFGESFVWTLLHTLTDETWLAENLLSYVIFGLVVSWMVHLYQKNVQREKEEPYQGWKLVIRGYPETKEYEIYPRDAEEFRTSDFAMWKYVKSCVSSYCYIKTPSLDEARQSWLTLPADANPKKEDRIIAIDFSRMSDAHVKDWLVEPPATATARSPR